jgi:hypothetical protein
MQSAGPPDFGELLSPVLAQVPAEARPRFLALLERTAADRYRQWADAWPHHRAALLGCAASEDEIADRIDAAFPCDTVTLEALRALLPAARDIYYRVFDGMPIAEQLRLQAGAELQGALAWQRIADRLPDSGGRAALVTVLDSCSALERTSSTVVEGLLGRPCGSLADRSRQDG